MGNGSSVKTKKVDENLPKDTVVVGNSIKPSGRNEAAKEGDKSNDLFSPKSKHIDSSSQDKCDESIQPERRPTKVKKSEAFEVIFDNNSSGKPPLKPLKLPPKLRHLTNNIDNSGDLQINTKNNTLSNSQDEKVTIQNDIKDNNNLNIPKNDKDDHINKLKINSNNNNTPNSRELVDNNITTSETTDNTSNDKSIMIDGAIFIYTPEEITLEFGNDVGQKLIDKKWQNKKEALDVIRVSLSNRSDTRHSNPPVVKTDIDFKVFKITSFIILRCFEENVVPILLSSFDLLRCLIETHSDLVEFNNIRSIIEIIAENLINKLTTTNNRIAHELMITILSLSRMNSMSPMPIFAQLLLKEELPLRPRLLITRLLIPFCQLKPETGFLLLSVLGIAIPALDASDEKTRHDAIGVICDCYKLKGEIVNNHIGSIRSAILKNIQKKFSEIDSVKEAKNITPNSRKSAQPIDDPSLTNRSTASAPSGQPIINPPARSRDLPFSYLDDDDERLMDEILGSH